MNIEIKEIGSADLKAFIMFPFDLFKEDPYWVPPLISDEVNTLSEDKNGAFEYCDVVLFLAYKNNKIVGRIAGIINKKENEMKGESQAKFGWFDFMDDQEVSAALLSAVEKWAASKNCKTLEGPLGFSNLDKMGMLIEGFEYMPTITSLYNFPYYQTHIESCGYEKAADWVEYQLLTPQVIPDKVQRFAKLIGEKYKLRLIDIQSQGNVKKYARKIFDLFNETHEELHGFTVLNDKQVEGYINRYYRLARLDLITMVVDENDELVGYAVSFPTLSKAFQKMKGRLWPFGIYHLYKARKSNERVTMYLIGVAKKYQGKGVTAIIFQDHMRRVQNAKMKYVESNPELESNANVRVLWNGYNPVQHKRRRSYIKNLHV